MIWNGMRGCSKPDLKTIYKPVLGICKNHKNIEYEVEQEIENDPKYDDLPWEKRDHGLFIGYGPTIDPKYAVTVIVEHGGSGSGSAAPIASDIFKYLFNKKLHLKRNEIFNV